MNEDKNLCEISAVTMRTVIQLIKFNILNVNKVNASYLPAIFAVLAGKTHTDGERRMFGGIKHRLALETGHRWI